MTSTTRTGSPKNKTGLYAAPSLAEVKSVGKSSTIAPLASSQIRNTRSAKLLLALSEQKHHQIQQSNSSQQELTQYYPIDQSIDTTTDSHSTTNALRNGFRPSAIRRQKQRILSAMSPREDHYQDLKDVSVKQSLIGSPGSARLKSEIDHLSSKLKLHDDSSRSRFQLNREMTNSPQSALSNFTSFRPSSASTNPGGGRNHQRFPSTTKNQTANNTVSIPGIVTTSIKPLQISSAIPTSSATPATNDYNRHYINRHIAHAYQVPQQSNIGSESAFPSTSLTTTIRKRATKTNVRKNGNKAIACPFYVIYLTNLTTQQTTSPPARANNTNQQNEKIPSPVPLTATTTPRKGTATTRIGTAHSRHTTNRRQINSPISTHSRSIIDDDENDNGSLMNIAPYYNHKRFSAKMTAFEHENSHLLKDVLRTTAWNHVPM